MDWQPLGFLVVLTLALWLFATEKLRVDVTAMLVLLILVVTGLLDADQALSGFSSEPAIIVAAVFVISAGLAATGLTERLGQWIGRVAGRSESRAIAVVMPAVAALSAFTHHVMVTAMMVPILLRHARENDLAASRLLMPMSLAASLGTTLTLVSAPAFLLADNLLSRQGGEGLRIFSITPIGIALVTVGIGYMLLARWLLPRRSGEMGDDEYLRLDRYRTELLVGESSHWIDRPMTDLHKALGESFRLVGWVRGQRMRNDLEPEALLAAGDILLVDAAADDLMTIHDDPGIDLLAIARPAGSRAAGSRPSGSRAAAAADADPVDAKDEAESDTADEASGSVLVQAVVASGSEFIGRSVGDLDLAERFGTVVVGLWRRDGLLPPRLSNARLRAGDVLVLWGKSAQFAELSTHHGFLMLMPFEGQTRRRWRAPLALTILAFTVLAASTEWLPAPLAFLFGAILMVVTRCLDVDQAYRAIDLRIFVMIAGVIPLGIAMEETGTATLLANGLSSLVADWPVLAVLLVLFSVAAVLTQIMSDSATTVLLGPIAIALARSLDQPPTPFVVCTALGAVVAFLTPIGHHGNLLILGPGQYRFADFLRIGLPLTIIIGLVCTWLARWLWLDGSLLPFLGG